MAMTITEQTTVAGPPHKSKRSTRKKDEDSVAEILLMKHLKELGLDYMRELHFHPQRKWRFDFSVLASVVAAWRETKLAIEIEGGSWIAGRHNRGKGFEADIRKYNEAAKLGWTVIRFTPNMIIRGESKAFLQQLFRGSHERAGAGT